MDNLIQIRVKNKSLRKSSKVRAYEREMEKRINEMVSRQELLQKIDDTFSDLMIYGTPIKDGNGNRVDPSKWFANRLSGGKILDDINMNKS